MDINLHPESREEEEVFGMEGVTGGDTQQVVATGPRLAVATKTKVGKEGGSSNV